MSIIINGLNLPPISDTNGIINLSIDCYGQVVISNTYPTKILKAEQIPKHGRLIDADVLSVAILNSKYWDNADEDVAWELVQDAPTVTEAEGEE